MGTSVGDPSALINAACANSNPLCNHIVARLSVCLSGVRGHHHASVAKLQAHQEGTLRVESIGAAHIDATISQELQESDVVPAVALQGETNSKKIKAT